MNGPVRHMTDKQFQKYVTTDKLFNQIYRPNGASGPISDTPVQSEEVKRQKLSSSNRSDVPLPENLMLVNLSYDNRVEKLNILERRRRKVYQEQETIYEL